MQSETAGEGPRNTFGFLLLLVTVDTQGLISGSWGPDFMGGKFVFRG